MIQFLKNIKMDTIKVSLIIAITIIAYYLLMQWPPATTQNLTAGDQTPSEIEKQNNDKKVEVISNYKGLADSEDTLTALEEQPLVGVDTKASPPESLGLGKVFYFENEVIRMGVDAFTGRFVSSEMKKIKQTKGGEKSLFVLGNRVLDSDENCNVNEGATISGARCIGKYYASSGFFSKEGYLNPNFNKIEKESLGGNKSAYTLSGEYENFSFVRKIIIEESAYAFSVEDSVKLNQRSEDTKTLVPYIEIVRDGLGGGLDGGRFESYTYTGPVFSTESDTYRC